MRESTLEFIFNLQKIVFRGKELDTFEQHTCILPLRGPSHVKAGDIPLPSNLEILNPEESLATIVSAKCNFDVKLVIQQGPAVQEGTEIHTLAIPTVFTPLKNLNYNVEVYKVLGEKDVKKERLFLEICTNGSLKPREAIQQALQELLYFFSHFVKESKRITIEHSVRFKLEKLYMTISIEELNLSVRSSKCLKKAQIHTVTDLMDYSKKQLLEIKNFGNKSAEEVIEVLQNRFGLSLPTE
jgi:DNA-directed RNA polymerase subunit alpha